MEKGDNENSEHDFSNLKNCDTNESFVKKVKSRVSDFIPSSITKWFSNNDSITRSTVRHRDDDEDDEDSFVIQPPAKRVKVPCNDDSMNSSFHFPITNDSLRYVQHSTPNNLSPATNNVSSASKKLTHFPEPIAGPSGIKPRRLLIPNRIGTNSAEYSDKDSDSESTSGYSSVARVGGAVDSHLTVPNSMEKPKCSNNMNQSKILNLSTCENSRSLFSESTVNPKQNTSLSSRRPSFNVSIGSTNLIDRTLSTKRIVNSPFYNGSTVYGGASAYGRRLGVNDSRASSYNSVQIKPVNDNTPNLNTTLSKTAKRILTTLEQYASPVSDVRKIPYPTKRPRVEGTVSKYTGAYPYMVKRNKVASNNELQVPTVPELLKMKERLQDSTVAVRQIATTSNSSLNQEQYMLRTNNSTKHTNKMKTKVSTVRSKNVDSGTVEEVKLPNIPLPISTFPKFDFSLPPPTGFTKSTNTTLSPTVIEKSQNSYKTPVTKSIINNKEIQETENKSTSENNVEFKFSNPLVIGVNMKSIIAINNYRFSEPLSKKLSASFNFKSSSNNTVNLKKIVNKNNGDTMIQPAAKLATGSVMDVLGKKNTEDNLMDKFKPAAGTWECSVCMIRCLPDKTKCPACETPRSSAKTEPLKVTTATAAAVVKTNAAPVISNNTGLINIKPASATWQCDTCWIRNNMNLNKCAACDALKPGAKESSVAIVNFGDTFKKKQTEWECSTCMVKNSNELLKCQCCESLKPGSENSAKLSNIKKDTTVSKFNFGIDNSGISPGGFTFGIKSTANIISTSITTNSTTTATVTKSIFGNTSKENANSSPNIGFKFGIKATEKTAEPTKISDSNSFVKDLTPIKPNNQLPTAELEEKKTAVPVSIFAAPTPFAPANKETVKTPDVNIKPIETRVSNSSLPTFSITSAKETESANKIVLNTAVDNKIQNKEPAIIEQTNDVKVNNVPFTTNKPVVNTNTPTNLFNFGAKRSAPSSSTPFGNSSSSEPPKSIFKMSSPSEPTAGTSDNKSIFGSGTSQNPINNGFGSSATSGFGATKPTIFGSSTSTTFNPLSTQSTAKETKPFAFGSGETANKLPTFNFGQESNSTVESPKAPLFNFSSGTNATPSATFNFSANAANPAQPSSSFNFSANKMEAPTFNSPAPNVSSVFNTPAPNVTASFGTVNPPAAFNTPGFGVPTQRPVNMFAVPTQPVQNGGFSFGANNNNNNTKTGFNFGGAAPNVQLPPSSSVFAFGAANAGKPPMQEGFNFNAGSAPPPTFDANVKATFNFTGGSAPPSFSAQPGGESAVAGRRIRKAVRRAQR